MGRREKGDTVVTRERESSWLTAGRKRKKIHVYREDPGSLTGERRDTPSWVSIDLEEINQDYGLP